jgi:hypothetical protein
VFRFFGGKLWVAAEERGCVTFKVFHTISVFRDFVVLEEAVEFVTGPKAE